MSRLRRLLQPVNWKYALGELALIVAGIWIALAANDWNERRHEREAELWALRQIHASLSAELATLRATDKAVREKEQRIGILADHLRRDAPYADSLDAYFGALYGFHVARVNASPMKRFVSVDWT